MKTASIVLAVSLVAACGGEPKPATTPTTTTTATPTASAAPAKADTERKAVGANLTVSDEIFRLCHLDAQSDAQAAPKFAFDESLISKADAVVLDKIATCLTTGPLAGRHVQLTGRADPRGTEEYNMSLGAKRAHGVSSYLEQQKVQGTHLNETSRGSLDATGTDEATWAQDRRVDIALLPQ
jgi:outer membrane protein OmpA-like peptidoglycan-associated protein